MENDEKLKAKTIETYAEDMAKIIENDSGGLVKKIIHGEEKHRAEKQNLSPDSTKNKLFSFAGALFLVLALVIMLFFLLEEDRGTVMIEQQATPIIFNDHDAYLEVGGLKKEEIINAIVQQIGTTKVKAEGVEGIHLMENGQVVGLRRFLSLSKSNFVPSENPLFVSDNFLMGIVNNQGMNGKIPIPPEETGFVPLDKKGFFILLKMRLIVDIFGSLRTWEETMLSDLHRFFQVEISGETNYLFSKDFEDGIVENKNARMLYDKDGKLIIVYVFANDNSVIITNREEAVHEIMLRLISGQGE